MEGYGRVAISKAPDFSLSDQDGKTVTLNDALKDGPIMLAFYPGDFTPVCTKQLCNYRDNIEDFKKFPISVYAISSDTSASHHEFVNKHGFPFTLLSDPGKSVAKAYNCTSLLMFGGVSRAIFILNKAGMILYQYVEPTTLTSRKASEILGVLADLRTHKLI
jgi:peroxiredoxin Q/BCP